MLLQASKGDTRTNILQAPKVTMFNGQTASVNDTSQRPFVTSIIPVVGDFAAAQMPVITVLNDSAQELLGLADTAVGERVDSVGLETAVVDFLLAGAWAREGGARH